ncbi:MAG: hypothetical protein LBH25_01960 [Fibromonadaceae bacterium]|jgi:hypothetical protein|nr:hypothetical protein [Fibromonadaceae bacterium]
MKIRHAALAAIFAMPLSVYAQCFNTEEQYAQKVRDMQEQCNKIIAMVPCAMGYSDNYPFQDMVLRDADDNALVNLAISVEAFIKYHSSDSIYMDKDISDRLKESVSKVNVKQRLINTRSLQGECASFIKDGKTLYRGASLRVLDPELYKQARAEISKIEKEEAAVSSSSVSVPVPQDNAAKQQNEVPKINLLKKFTNTAKKYAPLAGKTILRFFFPVP